jgi:hypothetical protein
VFLKNEGRIEALFYLYFLVLLVQALIERELRRAMQREQLSALPLYPEERATRRPTAEQILRLLIPPVPCSATKPRKSAASTPNSPTSSAKS